jgi:hypothetical protein
MNDDPSRMAHPQHRDQLRMAGCLRPAHPAADLAALKRLTEAE